MNKDRRKEIEKARGLIEEAKALIDQAFSEEQDYYDNMPEGLQSCSKGDAAQAAVNALSGAADQCDEVLSSLEEAISE